ncbi:ferric reductase-like transmembrane domain-containing protein [Paenibacillus elgii]|uniref:ferric reductase-like transmembrane domain-containing protein n=1 Tax=Paenibacillus elgii TaxID=189691 RepID=UPI0013D4A57D|nr:ferric reductase-like transmembrane domain-containing protein [Paenibacillus elgii]
MSSLVTLASWLSTWGVIKAAGFTSYLCIFVSVVLGAFSYGTAVPAKLRGILLPAHQLAGWLGFLFGLLHGAVLTIDTYQPFSLAEILIPFTAKFHPWASGLGTVALYILAAILISSDCIKSLGKKAWRAVHRLSYPLVILAFLHGLSDGSDSDKIWAFPLYAGSTIIFAAAGLYRAYIQWKADRKPLASK